MIFGEYPCCNGQLNLSMPEKTPTFAKENCPHCGKLVWHKFSRIQSESYTEDQFNRLYEANDDDMTIKEKGRERSNLSPEMKKFMDDYVEKTSKDFADRFWDSFFDGDGTDGGGLLGLRGKK